MREILETSDEIVVDIINPFDVGHLFQLIGLKIE